MPAKSRKVIQEISVSEFKAKCLSFDTAGAEDESSYPLD